RTTRGIDPQRDVRAGILGGERKQLCGEQRAIVVVEHTVEHEYPPQQQLLPDPLAELGNLVFVSHASSLRHRYRPNPPSLLTADRICPQQRGPARARVRYSAVPWPRAYAG